MRFENKYYKKALLMVNGCQFINEFFIYLEFGGLNTDILRTEFIISVLLRLNIS